MGLRHHDAPNVGDGIPFVEPAEGGSSRPAQGQHSTREQSKLLGPRNTGFSDLRLREYLKLLSIMEFMRLLTYSRRRCRTTRCSNGARRWIDQGRRHHRPSAALISSARLPVTEWAAGRINVVARMQRGVFSKIQLTALRACSCVGFSKWHMRGAPNPAVFINRDIASVAQRVSLPLCPVMTP